MDTAAWLKGDEVTAALTESLTNVPEVAHYFRRILKYTSRRSQRASIYWIVNLVERVVEVYRRPVACEYEQMSVHQKGSQLRVLAFPDVELAIDDFLR
jgi:hypothetical protein